MTTRTDIVASARTWVGTAFHHQARLKGVGVDCIGVVIGVARELGLVAPGFDVLAYPRVPDGRDLMDLAALHMTRTTEMRAGDVVVIRFGGDPQHFGILSDYRHGGLSMIHADAKRKLVIETRLLFSQHMQFVAAFTLPGVD